MKTFLIINNDNQIISSYQADEKDETSNYKSHLHCPPHAHHYELPSHLDKDNVKLEHGVITPEQTIIISPGIPSQPAIIGSDEIPEVLYQAAIPEVLDVDGVIVLTPAVPEVLAVPAVPAVLAQPEIIGSDAIIEIIPAVFGLRLVEDSAKILNNRQAKANDVLNQIRNLRAPLLDAVDKKINIAEDDGVDTVALRAYRKELRNCTEILKKISGEAKLSCEHMIADEFNFPSLGV